ncbi:unnamed protein product, partial [Amoebophrya sp. A25]
GNERFGETLEGASSKRKDQSVLKRVPTPVKGKDEEGPASSPATTAPRESPMSADGDEEEHDYFGASAAAEKDGQSNAVLGKSEETTKKSKNQ